jgi:hypothetical protein
VDLAALKARGSRMKDLKAKLEKLLAEAEDCELIGRLATAPDKRILFRKLAVDLRANASEIQAVIAEHLKAVPAPGTIKDTD